MRTSTLFHLCISLILMSGSAKAQPDHMGPPDGERLNELKAQKAAYITTKLGLTTEQAQAFWPIYNEFDEAREKIRRERRAMHKDGMADPAPTENKAREVINKHLANQEKELAVERQYTDRFIKTIGAVKTLDLFTAEHDFNREVLHRFREKRENEGKRDLRSPRRQ